MSYDLNLDFVSLDTFNGLAKKAESEGELDSFNFTYNTSTKYKKYTCPKCGAVGFFKVRFLGKLLHSDCGWTGYMDSGTYFLYQLKSAYISGFEFTMIFQDEKKDGPGIIGILVSLLWGLFVRLPIGIVLLIINIILNITNKQK